MAAVVAMSTITLGWGSTPSLPSSSPGISRNCRRISSTMAPAALPTAVIVVAPTTHGRTAPKSRPMSTALSVSWSTRSVPPAARRAMLTSMLKAAKRATTVSTAEPMAKPLPTAAVVLPTESSSSVISRTSGPRPDISEMPPPLSAMGPYASTVITMAVPASMPTAARAMP
jgi:hypothetical protein